jgi:Protein of unknown function (DUF3429)
MENDPTTRKTAQLLGYGGLLPFIVLALIARLDGVAALSGPQARSGVAIYGAIIATFMGALFWAYAVVARWKEAQSAPQVLIKSIAPALAMWLSLWLATPRTTALLAAVVLIMILAIDWFLQREPWYPQWFWKLRVHLTVIASACLLIAAV